jgi:hypothetical protein
MEERGRRGSHDRNNLRNHIKCGTKAPSPTYFLQKFLKLTPPTTPKFRHSYKPFAPLGTPSLCHRRDQTAPCWNLFTETARTPQAKRTNLEYRENIVEFQPTGVPRIQASGKIGNGGRHASEICAAAEATSEYCECITEPVTSYRRFFQDHAEPAGSGYEEDG